jgi:hypothetical protein
VCGACSVGGVAASTGVGWGCLGLGAVCGSLIPHIGGSSSWGEVSSTAGRTVSPIQVYQNTRGVEGVGSTCRRLVETLIGGLFVRGMAGSYAH